MDTNRPCYIAWALFSCFILLLSGSIGYGAEKITGNKGQNKPDNLFETQEIDFLNKIAKKDKKKDKGKNDNYILNQEDVLDIFVWKNKELSKKVTVRSDGMITLPLIDDILAEGLTTIELKNVIVKKLEKYIEEPHVTVSLEASNSSKFFILGEVAKTGVFPLSGETSVLQAITLAGGFKPFAATNKIFVLRKKGNKTKRIDISYKKIIKGRTEQNIILKRGDIIIVP